MWYTERPVIIFGPESEVCLPPSYQISDNEQPCLDLSFLYHVLMRYLIGKSSVLLCVSSASFILASIYLSSRLYTIVSCGAILTEAIIRV